MTLAARIRELEALALKTGQTQIFIETPYRNLALAQALQQALKPGTRLAASCGLMVATTTPQTNFSAPVSVWRAHPPALNWGLPAVFLIGP